MVDLSLWLLDCRSKEMKSDHQDISDVEILTLYPRFPLGQSKAALKRLTDVFLTIISLGPLQGK